MVRDVSAGGLKIVPKSIEIQNVPTKVRSICASFINTLAYTMSNFENCSVTNVEPL